MAAALCAGMVLSLLSGCGKKEEKKAVDADADAVTLNDTSMKEDVANFLVRFDQAKFESSMGQFYSYYASSYYGTTNYWDLDFSGQGQTVADLFKTSEQTVLEQLMLCSEHASDYDIVLTDDEKQKISDAAASFIASNSQDTLDAMNATQEVVEEALTYLTIQSKVEQEMTKDVDTNVTDEEAAQRDVDYVSFYASAEADTEAVSEGMTERTTENASEEAPKGLASVRIPRPEAQLRQRRKSQQRARKPQQKTPLRVVRKLQPGLKRKAKPSLTRQRSRHARRRRRRRKIS